MSKFFGTIENMTLDDLSNVSQNELNIKNYPNVQCVKHIDESFWQDVFGMSLEEMRQEFESMKGEMTPEEIFEAEMFFKEIENLPRLLYTNCPDFNFNFNYGKKRNHIDNLDNNLKEVDLGLRTADGKKILFADRNLLADNPEHGGGYFQWGSLEGVIDIETSFKNFDELENKMSMTGSMSYPMFQYGLITGTIDSSTLNQYIEIIKIILRGQVSDIPFDRESYKYYDSVNKVYTKYNSSDSLNIIQPEDDITRLIGGGWEMPSAEIMNQLLNNIKSSETDTTKPLSALFKLKHNETGEIVYQPGYYRNTYIALNDSSSGNPISVYALAMDNAQDFKEKYEVLGVKISNNKLLTSIYLPLYTHCYGTLIFLFGDTSFCGYWTSHVGTARPYWEFYDNPNPYPTESCAVAYNFFGLGMTNAAAITVDNANRFKSRHIRPIKIVD